MIDEAKKNAMAIEDFYGIKFVIAPKGATSAQTASAKADKVADVEVLIEELGKKKGFLGKGGKVDVDRTARIVLRDWQEGAIKIK